MRDGKFQGKGLGNLVLRELKAPLEELAAHPDVHAVHPGRSFNRAGGAIRGMSIGPYDATTNRLKLNCHTKSGGQEVYVLVRPEVCGVVLQYIRGLNQKYF